MQELHEFGAAVFKNLLQPLLLFFYMGFLIPIIRVGFDFPHVIYQALTMYLLIAIGWKGGEELGEIFLSNPHEFYQAGGFMVVGFITNFFIGILAFIILRTVTRLRKVDAATVAAYYGSDSAGTFVTCTGVLATMIGTILMAAKTDEMKKAHISLEPSVVRKLAEAHPDKEKLEKAMKDAKIPVDQQPDIIKALDKGEEIGQENSKEYKHAAYMPVMLAVMEIPGCLVGLYLVSRLRRKGMDRRGNMPDEPGYDPDALPSDDTAIHGHGHREKKSHDSGSPPGIFSWEMMHEVFLNPGLYLLFGGILIGFIGELQGKKVVEKDDPFLVTMFHGVLCLFLLEMGMTASKRIRDLRSAGPAFIAYGLIAPNIFATIGLVVAHCYSLAIHEPFEIGTYALFAVLCGASSYIAVPAVQRMAIPEASPTLPLAASLGLTFSYNVTIGIQVYILIAKKLNEVWPVVTS
jgi:uncharacterized protein